MYKLIRSFIPRTRILHRSPRRQRTKTGLREAARRVRQGWPIEQTMHEQARETLRLASRSPTWQDPRQTHQSPAYLEAMERDPTFCSRAFNRRPA